MSATSKARRRTARSDRLRRPRASQRYRGNVIADQLAMPPRAGLAVLLCGREAIQIEERADEPWPLATEWICSQEPQRRAVAVEKLGEKRHEPLVIHRRRHRREPHEPVQAEVVGRDLRRPAPHVALQSPELV